MPSSTSPSAGPLACPRCAVHYPLDQRFCELCGMPLVYAGKSGEEPITDTHERARKVKPQYSRGEAVKVGFARNQSEAELIQGLLLEEGIPSFLKRSRGFDVPDFLAAGPRDVLVPESGAEAARELLASTELEPEEEERSEVRGEGALAVARRAPYPVQLAAWIFVSLVAAAAVVWLLYQLTS